MTESRKITTADLMRRLEVGDRVRFSDDDGNQTTGSIVKIYDKQRVPPLGLTHYTCKVQGVNGEVKVAT